MSKEVEHGEPYSGVKSPITNIATQAARAVRSGTSALSDWILDWTPFVLVVTYFIVTTAIFVLCNEGTIKVFYFFYMATNFYIAAACVIESFLGLTPVRDARKAAIAVEGCGQFPSDLNGKAKDLPIIDVVIVAYLPNEKVSHSMEQGFTLSMCELLSEERCTLTLIRTSFETRCSTPAKNLSTQRRS